MMMMSYSSRQPFAMSLSLPGISNSLWWTIHPVRDGTLAVRDQQSDLTTDNWRLYDSAFQLVRPERSSSDTKVYPVGNQTHYFWFAGPDSEIGEQELLFEQVDRPANDNFSDAAPITGYTSDVYANGEARSYPVTGWNFSAPAIQEDRDVLQEILRARRQG